jgi:hypothetical protein
MLPSIVRPSASPSREPASPAPSADREVAAQFEALLLRTALAPVAKAMGFYGDLVVSEATRDIARGLP